MPSPVDGQTLAWAMEKLGRAFPGTFGGPEKTAGMTELWRELLDAHEWITPPVFVSGVYAIVWEHKGDFVPGPAVALDFFRNAERAARTALEKLERAAATALPDAAAGWSQRPGPERAAFLLRHLAIGKLRAQRAGGTPDPTEDEIGAAAEQIRRSGFMRRALLRIAAGEAVGPGEFAASLYEPTRNGRDGSTR